MLLLCRSHLTRCCEIDDNNQIIFEMEGILQSWILFHVRSIKMMPYRLDIYMELPSVVERSWPERCVNLSIKSWNILNFYRSKFQQLASMVKTQVSRKMMLNEYVLTWDMLNVLLYFLGKKRVSFEPHGTDLLAFCIYTIRLVFQDKLRWLYLIDWWWSLSACFY